MRKRRKNLKNGYFQVSRDLVSSVTFNGLSHTTQLVYFNIKYFMFSTQQDVVVEVAYVDLPIKISSASWHSGVRELAAKGLIIIVPGSGKKPNAYQLSNLWRLRERC